MPERSARRSPANVPTPGATATHYEVLGVPADAAPDRVRSAYRDLARRLHPDVNKDAAAHTFFLRVQAAYEVVGDAARRHEYDLALEALALRAAASRSAHFTWTNIANDSTPKGGRRSPTDFDEMYDAFFGGGNGPTA